MEKRKNGSPPKTFNLGKSEMDLLNKFMFEPVPTQTNSIGASPKAKTKNLTFDFASQKCQISS